MTMPVSLPPQASIIICAWRASLTLERAVESALSQKDIQCEILLVDDCSPDDTYDLIRELEEKHTNVKAFQTSHNMGPSAARNLAMRNATGEWIVVLDADDTMENNRLSHMIGIAHQLGADVVFDNMTVIQDRNRTDFIRKPLRSEFDLAYYVTNNLSYLSKPSLGYLKPVIRREFLLRNAISYNEALRNSEDYMLILDILACGGKVIYTPECGYNYYIYTHSASAKFNHKQNQSLVTAEQNFIQNHIHTLTKCQKVVIERHIYYRILSEDVYSCLQLIKDEKFKDFSIYLWKLGICDSLNILRIITDIAVKKLLNQSRRV